jgi:hypothetical protein
MHKQVGDKKQPLFYLYRKILKESLKVGKNRAAKIFFIRNEYYRMFPP